MAQFTNFNSSETFSSVAATGTAIVPGTGGILAYTRTVFVPPPNNVLYVTISAIGNNHGGESNFLSCNVDGPGGVPANAGQVCNPGPTTSGT